MEWIAQLVAKQPVKVSRQNGGRLFVKCLRERAVKLTLKERFRGIFSSYYFSFVELLLFFLFLIFLFQKLIFKNGNFYALCYCADILDVCF